MVSALVDVPVLHWHGDQFDVPHGAERLASTAICSNQAFAIENYALGLQFHLEVDLRYLERWLVGHAAELAAASVDPRELRKQSERVKDRLHAAATEVMASCQNPLRSNIVMLETGGSQWPVIAVMCPRAQLARLGVSSNGFPSKLTPCRAAFAPSI